MIFGFIGSPEMNFHQDEDGFKEPFLVTFQGRNGTKRDKWPKHEKQYDFGLGFPFQKPEISRF